MKNEIWKDVIGFQGHYQVSNLGRVKSLDRILHRNHKYSEFIHLKQKIIQPTMDGTGYYHVRLAKQSKYTLIKVHRLVAKHFLPNYSEYLTVNHKDLDKSNNCVDNLQMLTQLQNAKYSVGKRRKYYCIQTEQIVKSPKVFLKKFNISYNRYRFLQSIKDNIPYLNSNLHFKYIKVEK